MSIEIPICAFDAKTGLLCPICQAKAKNGQITDADIAVSKALVQLASNSRLVDSVSLVKSYQVDGEYLLEVREPGLSALRKPEVRAELERLLHARIWVTGATGSNKQFIEDLVYPFTISGLSTVWLPDGTKVSKARIERGGRNVGRKMNAVQKLAKAARGIDLLVDFEGTSSYASEDGRLQQRVLWNSAGSRDTQPNAITEIVGASHADSA